MQILSGIHHLCYLLMKKKISISSHSDASKITQLFHKTLLIEQQQICMLPDLNMYLKIIGVRQHTVLFANKNLPCMPSSKYYSS